MAIHIDIRLAPSSDRLTPAQRAIIMRHAQALAVELDETQDEDGSCVGTFLLNPIYPDSLLIGDGDDPYTLAEGRDYIKEDRRKAKIKRMKELRILRKAEEAGIA